MFYDEKADYKSYLPDIFQGIVEINALDSTLNIQIDKLNALIKDSVNNKSVQFANEQGVSRWEKVLGVTSPLKSTLQSRKNALKAKLMTKPPINITTLRNVVETFIGVPVDIDMWWSEEERNWGQLQSDLTNWGNVSALRWEDYYCTREPYVITIYYKGTENIPDLVPLYKNIYEMIPANIVVHINYRYASWEDTKIKYVIWEGIKVKTWNKIRLGVD